MMRARDLRLVGVGAGLALACGIAVRLYGDINARPRLATADIASIARDEALALAARDLDETALRRETAALRRDLTARINAYAGAHNLIILPANAGVFGAPDITDRLRGRLAAMTPDGTSPRSLAEETSETQPSEGGGNVRYDD